MEFHHSTHAVLQHLQIGVIMPCDSWKIETRRSGIKSTWKAYATSLSSVSFFDIGVNNMYFKIEMRNRYPPKRAK
jgi:hypothetical protein